MSSTTAKLLVQSARELIKNRKRHVDEFDSNDVYEVQIFRRMLHDKEINDENDRVSYVN